MSSLTDLYADDSFFTLTVYGRWGLVVISTLLAAIALWVLWKLTAKRSLPVRLLMALGRSAGICVLLSPEEYLVS